MILGKVAGSVVSTQKDELVRNVKFLLVEKIKTGGKKGPVGTGDFIVAMDAVGAGIEDYVILVAGSSARMTAITENRPCDLSIIGIVDAIELEGKYIYQKNPPMETNTAG